MSDCINYLLCFNSIRIEGVVRQVSVLVFSKGEEYQFTKEIIFHLCSC